MHTLAKTLVLVLAALSTTQARSNAENNIQAVHDLVSIAKDIYSEPLPLVNMRSLRIKKTLCDLYNPSRQTDKVLCYAREFLNDHSVQDFVTYVGVRTFAVTTLAPYVPSAILYTGAAHWVYTQATD